MDKLIQPVATPTAEHPRTGTAGQSANNDVPRYSGLKREVFFDVTPLFEEHLRLIRKSGLTPLA